MDISIIIPAYNAEPYIDKCLNTILNQAFKGNFEIIIINDGSKDDTLKILNKYAKKYKKIKIIDQKNAGQAVARNNALKAALGKYIMFVDVDDYIDETMLDKMYSVAIKENADIVYCDYYEHYKDGDRIVHNYITEDEIKNAILANYAPWGKLYNLDFFKKSKLEFMKGKLFEDIAIVPVLAALSKKSIRVPEALYYYNCSNVSSIRKKSYNKKLEDVFDSIDITYKNFKDKKLLEKYYTEIEYIYLDSFLKGGVFRFCDFKEGIENASILRKKIKKLFPKIINNAYYKKLPLNSKKYIFISYYFPTKLIYLMKRAKK